MERKPPYLEDLECGVGPQPLDQVLKALLVDAVGGQVQRVQGGVLLQGLGQFLAACQVEAVPCYVQHS